MFTNPLTVYDQEQLRQRRSVKWQAHPPDVLPMWVAEMDTPLAEPIAAALRSAVERGDTGYADPGGLPEAFSGFAERSYGWRPDPAEMRLVPDVMTGIVQVLERLTEPGDAVVLNTPAYPPFLRWLGLIGRRVVESPLGPDLRPDLSRLERDFAGGAQVFLLCNPHNPTGVVYTPEELYGVAELAEAKGVRVVADEIHAPLVYPGAVHTPFAALEATASAEAVTLVSASKAWNLAGLKTALVVPGPQAAGTVAEIPAEVSMQAALPGVIASDAAFSSGGPWLAELLAALDHNRELLSGLLADHLPEVGYRPPQGTYLAWLDCRALGLGDDPAAAFLREGRVALSSGPAFGRPGRGFARLNLASSPHHVTEAVVRMAGVAQRGSG